jgi:S-adenosylmethionine:tRNA ribosyltransferase-isomerase
VNTSNFDYFLPAELIAQAPAEKRDASRMMVLHRREQRWEHRKFSDVPEFLKANDVLVINNTKVIPARLFARKPGTGGLVEIFLVEEAENSVWRVLLRSRKRPSIGACLELEGGGTVTVLELGEEGEAKVRFHLNRPFSEYLEMYGHTPLPPYIKRARETKQEDRERYQTIYARVPGAIAAPTAGLHFTTDVFDRLARLGVVRAEITLHVGVGTFRPVVAARVEDHRMHDERYEVPAETAAAIDAARAAGGRVVAVGTTCVRTLETVALRHGRVVADRGRTDLFIYPPYVFKAVDVLLTNFHLPKSTLLMLVSAFVGTEFTLAAYAEAVREKYRFFSYGDCMLIL